MKLFKLLFSFCVITSVFTCGNNPQNPFTQDKAKVFLHLESSAKIDSDSTITDTVGNTIRIGVSYFMPSYFDSVVITVEKTIQSVDTFFVCRKADIKDDTAWFECAFKDSGTRTVTATGYVEGGYKPSAIATIRAIAQPVVPVNHKPVLIVTGRKTITTAEACTLFVSVNDSDTAQAHSFKMVKGPNGYAFSNQIFTWKPSPADTGIDSIVFTVADNGIPVMSDTQTIILTVNAIHLVIDSIKPTIKFLDPATDSMAISANTKMVKVIITDSSGISAVRFSMNSDTFPAAHADSVWTATITNLKIGYSTITISATDLSQNRNIATRQITIKYDPTLDDNTGPTITQISGPASNSRVQTDSVSFSFTISDTSGIDSAYYVLNGGTAIALAKTGTNTYSFNCSLTKSGSNQISLTATDKSSNHNHSSIPITLNLNRKPTCVTQIFPADGAQAVECSTGVTLKWSGASDADGDTIKYIVAYGIDGQPGISVPTSADSVHLPVLEGDTMYKWFLFIIAALDTVRCPVAVAASNSFHTRNHPAIISGFKDTSITVADTLLLKLTATDYEGIKKYLWDFNGDGITDDSSDVPSIRHNYSAANTYKTIVTVVDRKNAKTADTATIAVRDLPGFQKTYAGGYTSFTSAVVRQMGSRYFILTSRSVCQLYSVDSAGQGGNFSQLQECGGVPTYYETAGNILYVGYNYLLYRVDTAGITLWHKDMILGLIKPTMGNGWAHLSMNTNITLKRYDSTGTLLWAKQPQLAGDGNSSPFDFVQASDSGFAVLGNTTTGAQGDPLRVFLIRTRPTGDTIWTQRLNMPVSNLLFIKETKDKGFVSVDTGQNKFHLIKFSSTGSYQWDKTFSGDLLGGYNALDTASDGGYICAAQLNNSIALLKIDASGGTTWLKTFSGMGTAQPFCVRQTKDGGFIISGQTGSAANYSYLLLIKTDKNGNSGVLK